MPSDDAEKLRYVALAWGAGLGPAGMRKVIEYFGSVEGVLAADYESLGNPALRLNEGQMQLISTLRERLDQFREKLRELRDEHISVICDWEPQFPELLKQIGNPPTVICVAGRILPGDDPAINIVGTRRATEENVGMARELGRAFAENGVTVVSGLARGCDVAAHSGVLEANQRTIAVLGSGIRVIRPREHVQIARRIFATGAIVSEQPPDARPNVGRLMARNRIQSGLSRGVLVVASRETGGAMATAEHAEREGRKVYAVKWATSTENSRGTEQLLQQGAIPVRGSNDVPGICEQLAAHKRKMEVSRERGDAQQSLFEEEDAEQ